MKGLLIKPYWADLILEGSKTWEIRGTNTKVTGTVQIIKSGTGKIYGEAELVESYPLTEQAYNENQSRHRIQMDYGMLWYKKPHVWVFKNVKRYAKPIPYQHPQGAVIWVNL